MDAASEPAPLSLEKVPGEALAAPVTGVGLIPGSLRDQLDEGVQLLVFLRHFGCIFCREVISDLREAAEADPDYPRVLFFFQGSSTEGRAFMRRYWPGARAVADPNLEFYEYFGVRRASFLEGLGPSVLRARGRARAKGHENGPRSGDVWRMPGVFAVQAERVLWSHEARHAADHPDFSRIPEWISHADSL